jgi:hypothetical protein
LAVFVFPTRNCGIVLFTTHVESKKELKSLIPVICFRLAFFIILIIFGQLFSGPISTAMSQGFGGGGYAQLVVGREAGYPAQTASGNLLELTANTCYADHRAV